MKRFSTYLIYIVCTLSAVTARSHEVEIDEHVELVPIPSYDYSYGEASGAHALLALGPLLETFSNKQISQLTFEFDAKERHQWSNLPAGLRPRPGLNFGVMSDEQRGFLFRFLSASLDEPGYHIVAGVMAAEAYLATGVNAGRLRWSPENYWLSIYGEPSNTSKWAWAFGGHHLAINISIDMGEVISMSPHFVGAEPSQFTIKGIEYDVIADMHEAGYAIYQSLDATQKKTAFLSRAPRDVLAGARKDSVVPKPEGISVGDMTATQRALVISAAYEWVSHQPKENSTPSMQEIESELDDTYFAWAGDIDPAETSYFRIQGPSVIIELRGGLRRVGSSGRGVGHYHTVYRDPTNDYGLSPE